MLKAVIFDMDGVLSHTEPFHAKVEADVLGQYGIRMAPQDILERFRGIAWLDMCAKIFAEAKKPLPDRKEIDDRKYLELLRLDPKSIIPVPGVLDLIRELKKAKLPLGVASASRKDFVLFVLMALGILEEFDAVVTTEEVERAKPAPDVFLLCAEKLRAKPRECIVIEDASSGTLAAKAAGMTCIGFRGIPPSDQDLSAADLEVSSFAALNLQNLSDLTK